MARAAGSSLSALFTIGTNAERGGKKHRSSSALRRGKYSATIAFVLGDEGTGGKPSGGALGCGGCDFVPGDVVEAFHHDIGGAEVERPRQVVRPAHDEHAARLCGSDARGGVLDGEAMPWSDAQRIRRPQVR